MHSTFLVVTDTDLGRLNDGQLKDLMSRLVRAEMTRFNLNLSGLLAGGHQNAPDGGADIHVSWAGGPESTEFLLRRTTVFQVKATKMPAAQITREMSNKSAPRDLLIDLTKASGAYIIASNESCAVSPLEARRAAIRSALADVPGSASMSHDFYDAKRLSLWISRYPGIALWVKEVLGVGFLGWRAHGPWSADGRPGDLTFIDDPKPRAYFLPGGDGVAVSDCIQRLRDHLVKPQAVARIVGLSGMGKTRIAEALFDATAPTTVLNAGLAVYGDIAAQPTVSPMEAVERLVTSGDRAVLVVDSCLPDVHRRLVGVVLRPGSNVSLLTIDFDVEEDLPEHTLVVRIEDTSDDLIDQLLRLRFPAIGWADRRAIIGFSGGNTRIAIALAVAAEQGGSLATLSDPEILTRLFLNDRRQHDPALMRCAEAASLVYSFSVEEADGADAELPAISAWANVEPREMYRHVAELLDRGLAQKRGPWRAVLPHALADALGVPLSSVAQMPLTWDGFDAPPLTDPSLVEAMRTEALLSRSDVLRAVAAYDQSETDLHGEVARQWPEIHVGPGYTWERGLVKLPFSMGLVLPPLDLNRNAIAAADARRAEVGLRLEAVIASAQSAIDAALAERFTAEQGLNRVREFELRAARRAAEQADNELAQGAIDRVDWAAAQVGYRLSKLSEVEALRRVHAADAGLEDGLRRPLEGPELAITGATGSGDRP